MFKNKPPKHGFIWPFIFEPLRHMYRLYSDVNYRRFRLLENRLGRMPRYSEGKASFHGFTVSFPDPASFLSQFHDIFVNNIYEFYTKNSTLHILDIGANIGISTIYFKKFYPNSIVTALEPDPFIFKYLRNNIIGNKLSDVYLIKKAAWNTNSQLEFQRDGADGGRLSDRGNPSTLLVDTLHMNEFLDGRHFDFIKLDIEGAEGVVLEACSDHLDSVSHIFIEYHSVIGRRQDLDLVLAILRKANFRVHIQSIIHSPHPFTRVEAHGGYDFQLNIFGWKEPL